VLGSAQQPLPLDPLGTDMAGPTSGLVHVAELLPEICTIAAGSMETFRRRRRLRDGEHDRRWVARWPTACGAGVRPELELFEHRPHGAGEGMLRRRPARTIRLRTAILVFLHRATPYIRRVRRDDPDTTLGDGPTS